MGSLSKITKDLEKVREELKEIILRVERIKHLFENHPFDQINKLKVQLSSLEKEIEKNVQRNEKSSI